MKKSPLTKIQKFHFKRPFIYACPQLKFGSLCITINEKNEILGKYHLVFKLTLTESTLRMLHWFWVEVLFRFWVTPRLNVLCDSWGSHVNRPRCVGRIALLQASTVGASCLNVFRRGSWC